MSTKIWAHRGASAYAPENTLEAFGLASKMGADGVELDVYLTADGELAVHHDGNASRMTGGACEAVIIESKFGDLRKHAYPGAFADKYPRALIPTLGEVFGLLSGTGMVVNVELKAGGEGFAAAVLNCAADYFIEDNVIYSSFNHNLLREIKSINSSAPIAPLYGDNPTEQPWEYARELGAAAVHPVYKTALADGYIEKFHSFGIKVNPWTVDDPETIKILAERGADAIITNVPDKALAAIGR